MNEAERQMAASTIVDILNKAYLADPAALHALVCNRVPCNSALADHPTVQVNVTKTEDREIYEVGMLGVVNGIMEGIIGERIAAKYSGDGEGRFLGFCIYQLSSESPSI